MATNYAEFLRAPSTSLLASGASLNYITSTTTIAEPTAILKHLATQQKLVEKKGEKVLAVVEGPDSLFLETETTLKFVQGGGAYLPSMDENLLDEKTVMFPLLHVVSFDSDRKIKQIRLHWDQGTLLKQVEAIGRTGRNWPIRDGKAQIEAIQRSVKSAGPAPGNNTSLPTRPRENTGALRNQPASLALFAPHDQDEPESAYDGPTTAPRESARPVTRDFTDLIADQEKQTSSGANASPSKADGVIYKSGAGKHFSDIRLFKENAEDDTPLSPERKKTYVQKYDHFDFGDGEDAPPPVSKPSSRGHKSQPTFSFEDFNTPPKYKQKKRPDDEVHWGGEVDPPSPPKRNIVHAARKDADTHFTLTDHGDSPMRYDNKQKSTHHATATDLYRDPLVQSDNGTPVAASSRNTTSTNNGRRGDDFGAHYEIADEPSSKSKNHENARPNSKHATRSDMEQHWTWGTPEPERKIYKTSGDGLGGRKGGRTWSFGEQDA